jgi:Protein of unknown function (DUF2786)
MARAAADGRPAAEPSGPEDRAEVLRGIMADLRFAALTFVAQAKVEETARHWLADARLAEEDEDVVAFALGEALALALDVALFAPSASGTTAIDRLARQHRPADADERAALAALRRAAFRVLRVEGPDPRGGHRLLDLATGERLRLLDPAFPDGCEGLALAARLAPVGDDAAVAAGPLTPLDDAALEVARARMRPGGKGLTNPNRCAEAVYRHLVRFGGPAIPGLNRPPEGGLWDFPFAPEDGPVHATAFAWAEAGPDVEPSAEEVRAVRELAGEPDVHEALAGLVAARQAENAALAAAYERVLTIQVETIERRAALGLAVGAVPLDAVADEIRRAVRDGRAPPEIETVFRAVRARVRAGGLGRRDRPADAELDKVLARIQALRAKTVDRGCTEEEAIAAAGKVAELLDRYGLSLGEVELKEQACEGFGVDTGRRRFGPIDDCIPAVGAFCDCRVWSEKAADGRIRYVFFGLPADVAGARYLYELVERAFATETDLFKRSELYAGHRSHERRSATQSFQTGLAHGIARKLDELHRRREEAMRTETGRDLVPVKEGVVEDELAKLGLRFHVRGGGRGRYVLPEAYEAGQEAGERFEYRPGIGEARGAGTGG